MNSSAIDTFLYTSRLVESAGVDCVADIVKTARAFNLENSITGILVFDGERFCQYIEGPKEPLDELITRIARDRRHFEFAPKLHRSVRGRRLFSGWSMAYAMVDDDEPLQRLAALTNDKALDELTTLLPTFDIV